MENNRISFDAVLGSGMVQKVKMLGFSPLGLIAFITLGLAPLYISDQYIIHLLIISLMFGTLAMGFDFTGGFINVANFGYCAFQGLGAYTSAIVVARLGISPWIGLVTGFAMAGLVGFLTGILTLRLRGMYAAIMAWFLGMTLMSLAANLVGLTRGNLGLNVDMMFDTGSKIPYFYLIYVICFFSYIVLKMITKSNIGLAFKAIGQDQEAAEASGVNPTKYKVFNFTISCGIAGLAGGFYAHFMGILTPDVLHTKHTVEVLALAYIGGRGSLWGGLFVSFIIIPLFEYLKPLLAYKLVIYGLLLILVMILYPGGFSAWYSKLFGEKKDKKQLENLKGSVQKKSA